MPRSCACDRWLNRAAADIGFQALPPMAQLIFFRLLAAAVGAEEKGHLRFPCSVSTAVSRLLNQSETEAETQIAALADLGWLVVDEDGRGVWMAGAKAASARAEAAQVNGLRGGRPRKGETREAARERRQGAFMLPIAGGGAETQETEAEPNVESSRVAARLKDTEKEAAATREAPGWVSLGQELAEAAGMDGARGGFNLVPVKGWVDAGASADLLREVVRRCASRPGYRAPRSLQYFHQAVMDALRDAAPSPALPAAPSGYEAALREWQRNGAQGVPPSLAEWRASQAAA